jgi:hypothetical protein
LNEKDTRCVASSNKSPRTTRIPLKEVLVGNISRMVLVVDDSSHCGHLNVCGPPNGGSSGAIDQFEQAVRETILAASTMPSSSRVAFDCEGVDLGRYGCWYLCALSDD